MPSALSPSSAPVTDGQPIGTGQETTEREVVGLPSATRAPEELIPAITR